MNNWQYPDRRKHRTPNDWAHDAYPEAIEAFPSPFTLEESNEYYGRQIMKVQSVTPAFLVRCLSIEANHPEPIVYLPDEDQFLQYRAAAGLYAPISQKNVERKFTELLIQCKQAVDADHTDVSTILSCLPDPAELIELAKEIWVPLSNFFLDDNHDYLCLQNGVYQVSTDQLHEPGPNLPFRSKMPVAFDPDAECLVFLNAMLGQTLDPEDIEVQQLYLSQLLLPTNQSQKILVMMGEAGWGKGTIMRIIQRLFGTGIFGVLRDEFYSSKHEINRHVGKRILYHPDMPTGFLDHDKAPVFKQLVGGDLMWIDQKQQQEDPLCINGDFMCILSCNGKPRIRIDEDADAWMRRLAVIDFHEPRNPRIGKLDKLIEKEASGILNWMIEGRKKFKKAGNQIRLSEKQQQRVQAIVQPVDSVAEFVEEGLMAKKNGVVSLRDVQGGYLAWCYRNSKTPRTDRNLGPELTARIATTHASNVRHDLRIDNGKPFRGWTGLSLAE